MYTICENFFVFFIFFIGQESLQIIISDINVCFWFGLIWFSDISTIDGNLIPNSVFTYLLNIWLKTHFVDPHI